MIDKKYWGIVFLFCLGVLGSQVSHAQSVESVIVENSKTIPKVPPKNIPKIIIDPGHGGKDPGAISTKNHIQESALVLSISKKIATSLKKNLGANVLLTRDTDTFLELGERNRFANRNQCDLFFPFMPMRHKALKLKVLSFII
ncbi:MAG: N-acetylmuramoyl-L-alanine amidase [Deltaproteobacteria bacterium]|nr:MAG: N-acetylmuramoyl-L-alanine amidase [Deltaproteobacteria bacterium]